MLIDKLTALGFRYSARQWFATYLTGCTQQTAVECHLSSMRQVNCGVSQGSILGPLLFICYINNLPLQWHSSIPSLYADDTAILATGMNTMEVQLKLQEELDRVFVWFAWNKLSVNCQKTVSVLFTSIHSRYKKDSLNLMLSGEQTMQASNTKYLGLYVDAHLNFDEHVTKLCCKTNIRTKFLWRFRSGFQVIIHWNFCDLS